MTGQHGGFFTFTTGIIQSYLSNFMRISSAELFCQEHNAFCAQRGHLQISLRLFCPLLHTEEPYQHHERKVSKEWYTLGCLRRYYFEAAKTSSNIDGPHFEQAICLRSNKSVMAYRCSDREVFWFYSGRLCRVVASKPCHLAIMSTCVELDGEPSR